MKLLAIGDPHFRTDNIQETKDFTEELKQYLEKNLDIDTIIVLGDILHTHEKLHTDALNAAVDFFKMLVALERNSFVLVGNHDATSNSIFLTKNHWLNILKEWGTITVVDYPTKFKISNDIFITLCPYVPEGRFIEALDLISDWKQSKIIFGHQTLNGAKMGAIVAQDVEEWEEEYPMLISGHIHDKQRVKKNLYYTGSSLQHSYGEGSDKSLCLISIENNEINFEDVYLQIKRKKILYVDINNIEEVKDMLKSDIEYKIALKGDAIEEFKALKKSAIFKELSELDNVKNIVFKTKTVEKLNELSTEENRSNVISDDFCEHLDKIIRKTNDQYLISFYEHIMYDKEDISEQDILII